jgi:hypothetical protein
MPLRVKLIATPALINAADRVMNGAPLVLLSTVNPAGLWAVNVAPTVDTPAGNTHAPVADVQISNLTEPILAAVAVVALNTYEVTADWALEPTWTLRGAKPAALAVSGDHTRVATRTRRNHFPFIRT